MKKIMIFTLLKILLMRHYNILTIREETNNIFNKIKYKFHIKNEIELAK